MPSILSTRQSYQWIHRLAQKHKQLTSMSLPPTRAQALTDWLEIEFVYTQLALEGVKVTREAVVEAVRAPNDPADKMVTAETLKAFRLLKAVIERDKQKAHLDVDLLLKLKAPDGGGEFRQHSISSSMVRPENLPLILTNACRWFASSSISELNPVEQAAIAFLRFVEIAPFERHNERTALIAASLFTLRQELPPILIKPEKQADYRSALQEGLQMNTQAMVELVAVAIEQTLDEMLNWLK